MAENNALVEARKIKTREIDALQGSDVRTTSGSMQGCRHVYIIRCLHLCGMWLHMNVWMLYWEV